MVQNYGALRDFVPFVQFKKREKHPWRSVTFSCRLTPATLLKVTHLHGCFSRFLNCTNGSRSRKAPQLLTTPITQLCNLSISSGIFPDACKTAKLKPFFEKSNRTYPKNYHPISLLPLIPKILEKVIHEQATKFFDKCKILYKFQSGFRKNHSTDFCLFYLTDKKSNGFNSGLLTGMILINLQKAFDTIEHYILLQKWSLLGFSNEVIDWFRSYLRSRKFHVNVHEKFSKVSS